MKVWLYKATKTGVSPFETGLLANKDGFLPKNLNLLGGAQAPHVKDVAVGDIIHLYFVESGKSRELGAYEVITREQHPEPEWFGDRVEETALYVVADVAFLEKRDPDTALREDPVLECYTGWLLKHKERAMPYDSKKFRGQHTLVPADAPVK